MAFPDCWMEVHDSYHKLFAPLPGPGDITHLIQVIQSRSWGPPQSLYPIRLLENTLLGW